MNKKETAIAFLKKIIAGDIRKAFEEHSGPGFRHHNAFYPGTADPLIKGMEDNHTHFPQKTFTTKHVIGDGDNVAVHSLLKFTPDHTGISVVHLFRFEGDRIVEFWDVAQILPDDSPNENGPL